MDSAVSLSFLANTSRTLLISSLSCALCDITHMSVNFSVLFYHNCMRLRIKSLTVIAFCNIPVDTFKVNNLKPGTGSAVGEKGQKKSPKFYAVSLQFFWPFFPSAEPGPRLIIYHCQTMWNVVPERLKKKETAQFWVDRLRRFKKRGRDQMENCTISTWTTQIWTTGDTYRLFLITKTEDLSWRF